jgi:NADPH:quinone reductase-like Zn-dependent oxidoreductase
MTPAADTAHGEAAARPLLDLEDSCMLSGGASVVGMILVALLTALWAVR